jgi:hypothetical protein
VKAEARASGAGALVFGLILSCQASVNADANVSGQASADGEASGSADAELEGRGELTRRDPTAALNAGSGSSNLAGETELAPSRVLLGARHDLKLRSGKGTASCSCLAVALGGSRSSGMAWSAVPPAIDDATQLTIALSSDGVECKQEPKGSLGASYWGYRISGNDVIVLVEAARGGRPLTNGAVIPRPVGSGQVFVAPTTKSLPYGHSTEGKGSCKIGNPGQVRSTGFTQLELGVDAPVARTMGDATNGDAAATDAPTTIELPSN